MRRSRWLLTAASIVIAISSMLCFGGCAKSHPKSVTIEELWAAIEQHPGPAPKEVLPADVPEYPGWRGTIADHSDGVRSVSASTFDEPSKVIAFYCPKLEEAGWQLSQPVRELPPDEYASNSMMCSYLKGNRGVILIVGTMRPKESLAAHTTIEVEVYDSIPDDFFGPDKVFAPRPATSKRETLTGQPETN